MDHYYAVYAGGDEGFKPARYPYAGCNETWKENKYKTWDEAIKYVTHFLNVHSLPLGAMRLGHAYDYSGHGDKVVILRENGRL